jgi:hypothetical protein
MRFYLERRKLYIEKTAETPTSNQLHRKKSFLIFPSPAGMSLINLSLGGNNLYMTSLFPARKSLVCDIQARDGNIEKTNAKLQKSTLFLKKLQK